MKKRQHTTASKILPGPDSVVPGLEDRGVLLNLNQFFKPLGQGVQKLC